MRPKEITQFSYDYLMERSGADSKKLEFYLEHWKYRKPKNIRELFYSMVEHAQNKQGMSNYIGKIENLSTFLYGFDPHKVAQNYKSWEDVFDAIEESNYSPPTSMDKSRPKSSWVQFTQSIYSISKYLSRYKHAEEFFDYVDQFVSPKKPELRVALPLILSEEIHGYGFALACDFIKENVSPEFIKPDTNVRYISVGIGICNKEDSDFQVFTKVVKFAKDSDHLPYWVDKAFFLIGSRGFYKTNEYPNEEENRINSSKQEFVGLIRQKF